VRSSLKTIFQVVSVLAIVNTVGLFGTAGYLFATGALTAERVNTIAAVLRGEEEPAPDDAKGEDQEAPQTVTSEESIANHQLTEEILRRTAERKIAELHQKQVAVNLLMQKVTEDIERLEQERQTFMAQAQQKEQTERDEGFQKTMELLETSPPEVAKDLLLQNTSEEQAARMLLSMNTRKGTKIIQAAMEDPLLRPRMLKVFQLVNELAPSGSEWASIQPPSG
jgi:hypothetical protein